MRKALLILTIIGGVLAGPGFGFIFHDPVTCSEVIVAKVDSNLRWAQQLGYSAEQIAKLQTQIAKFQEYKAQFDQYYGTFASCYQAIQSGSWSGLATTVNEYYLAELARRQEEIDEAKAAQVRQDAHDAGLISADGLTDGKLKHAVEVLRNTEYYKQNPVLRAEVDQYLAQRKNIFDYNSAFLTKVLASIKQIQSRNQTIARLEEQNKQLATGDDQASVAALLGLNNQLLCEQIKQQNEIAELNALLLSRQVESEENMQQSIITAGDSDEKRKGVLDQILAPLQDGAPAPKK